MVRFAMQLLLVLALLALAPLITPEPAHDTPVQQSPRYVTVDDYIRDYLAAEWDAHAHDSPIKERAYCLRYQMDIFAGEWSYRVTQIAPADSQRAGVNGVSFTCPAGRNVATLHIHPPNTCLSETDCVPQSSYSYQCFPSDQDKRFLAWLGQPFGMIQCSREALLAFWP